ncbi:MAG: SBBP repeat-containing protein [Ignavibacteria bacterium]|nr:SBBP repeat-containing protein [Ignavibacteria bacterium]
MDYAEGRNSDLIVSKFDSNGDTLWSSRYGKFNNKRDDPTSITADNQGNVFITGYSEAMNHQRSSFFLKLNPDGDSVWVKNSMQPALYANSFIDFYGNVYTTGKTNDCVTIKYDQNGDSLWVKRYNGTGNSSDGGNLIKLSNSGTVYVSGYSMGSNGANSDIVTSSTSRMVSCLRCLILQH